MYQIFFFFLPILHSYYYVSAQPPPPFRNGDLVANFEPSLAVVTGVLAIMFTLTFVLLVYAKCCHIDLRPGSGRRQDRRLRQGIFFNRSSSLSDRFSGLDKTAIESLPVFRFSALKGSKQGLECSVCLSKFESVEILRLLPKCRHAFHVGCIDQWLEQHATCPLCRDRVSIEDEPSVYENSFRFLNQSEIGEESSLELYIEREEEEEEERRRQGEEVGGSLRFSIGESFRKILKLGNKEKPLLASQGNEKDEKKLMHKINHRIVVSDVVFKNRWSNVSSSDLMFLNSEMVNSVSSERFSSMDRVKRGDEEDQIGILRIKQEMEAKRMLENKMTSMKTMLLSENIDSGSNSRSVMVEPGRRSVSEIIAVPRISFPVHGEWSGSTAATASALQNGGNETEERRRRLWLPIAKNTAQWFANREKKNQNNTSHQHFDV
uniref:RING-type E3 ubiquitin transferase n=1 Tax=Noccaea caerulescens TaxID=107243 RepID=A0A1J3I1G4_NOCCA